MYVHINTASEVYVFYALYTCIPLYIYVLCAYPAVYVCSVRCFILYTFSIHLCVIYIWVSFCVRISLCRHVHIYDFEHVYSSVYVWSEYALYVIHHTVLSYTGMFGHVFTCLCLSCVQLSSGVLCSLCTSMHQSTRVLRCMCPVYTSLFLNRSFICLGPFLCTSVHVRVYVYVSILSCVLLSFNVRVSIYTLYSFSILSNR